MSKENVKLFYEALAKDKALQEKLKLIGEKYKNQKSDEQQTDLIYQNEIIPLAKASGFDFLLAELKEYTEEIKKLKLGELTEDELQAVIGGGACACVAAGGGGGDGLTCGCAGFGIGYANEKPFCSCVAIGGGGV